MWIKEVLGSGDDVEFHAGLLAVSKIEYKDAGHGQPVLGLVSGRFNDRGIDLGLGNGITHFWFLILVLFNAEAVGLVEKVRES